MPNKQTTEIVSAMKKIADPDRAAHSQKFFKTAPGEYGEGDKFLGVRVPETRKIARQYKMLSLEECKTLLDSVYHEIRLLALIVLVERFKKSGKEEKNKIFNFYMRNKKSVNSWDLVDCSAPVIVGEALQSESRDVLHKMTKSGNLWERRIAIMATFYFIRNKDYTDALIISEKLLRDNEDLIHKAVGWMLREIGNRNRQAEERFLKKHYKKMPRTMLRYAIEKFPEPLRKRYLHGTIG